MLRNLFISVLIGGLSASALAAWQADKVEVSFLTTKVTKQHTTLTEVNTFDKAHATLSDDGKFTGTVVLDSVNTGIDIRNERLRKYVFNQAKDGTLSVSGQVNMADISALEAGQSIVQKLPLHISFGQQQTDVTANVLIVRGVDDQITVTTLGPVMFYIAFLNVQEGVNQLINLAGLETIALHIPVTFHAKLTPVNG